MSEGRAVQAHGPIVGGWCRAGTGGVAIFGLETPGRLRGVGILGDGASRCLPGLGILGHGAAGVAGEGAGGLS